VCGTNFARSVHFPKLELILLLQRKEREHGTHTQAEAGSGCNFQSSQQCKHLKASVYVLPGNYLFLSAVCSEWRAVYAGIADQQLRNFGLSGNPKLVTCGARTTLFGAAVASPATARLACEFGVLPTNVRMQVIAGGHADIQILAALRELGIPLSEIVVKAAAL
jgi:hypothetical protein